MSLRAQHLRNPPRRWPALVVVALAVFGCSDKAQPGQPPPNEAVDAAGDALPTDADGGFREDDGGGDVDGGSDSAPETGSLDASDGAVVWSASVGTWCGPGDGKTTWLVANPDWLACKFRSQYIHGDSVATEHGLSVKLPSDALEQLPTELNAPAKWCKAGVCQTLPATLWLESYDSQVGARGRWQVALDDGTRVSGAFEADWCPWDDYLPPHPDAPRLARGLKLHEIAIFQAVKVPIMQRLVEVVGRNAEIVSGRPALVRAYVAPETGWLAKPVRARLTLLNRDPSAQQDRTEVYEKTMTVLSASSDSALDSTFNFSVPGESIREDTRYTLELLDTKPCGSLEGEPNGARFPEVGAAELRARAIGKVRVQLVPIHYQLDGTLLTPDTSPEQVERFRRAVTQLFPITGAEITVRNHPVVTTSNVLVDVLDQITALRDQESPERDVTYYGLVRFTETLAEYCAKPCVLGAAVVGELGATGASGGSGAGVAYNGDQAPYTFAHEMGHVYGRSHVPCNVQGDVDYPYRSGGIGSWGYDVAAGTLFEPSFYKDFMGYCSPVWVSDYTFARLQTYIAEVNRPALPLLSPSRRRFRTLILEPGMQPRWGLPRNVAGAPNGLEEQAEVHDSTGNVVMSVSVYRAKIGDLGAELVYVPEPRLPTWKAVRVRGHAPQAYATPFTVPRLILPSNPVNVP
jgi:hypothetical protein